jgi:hypothetical protein
MAQRKNPTIDMLLEIDGSVSTLSCRSDKSSSHIEQQQKLNKEL